MNTTEPTADGQLRANIVDIEARTFLQGEIHWRAGRIERIDRIPGADPSLPWLLPGFIDAHVHIESSMLPPAEFARLAVSHGTVAAVCDPHEVANVLGGAGVRFMLDNAARSPFHFCFGAPPCVPATPFETSGAVLDQAALETLLDDPRIGFLSEMMNFPGVLEGDRAVLAKIGAARRRGLPVDGHAPGLRGDEARRYAWTGISTDHECFELEEARDKLAAGMWVVIREGSAARNFETLHPLIREYPYSLMFCSDDKHPDDLKAGHIDRLVARAVAKGHDIFDVLRIACLNPIGHYGLEVGRLRPGDWMDGVLVGELQNFPVLGTWLRGVQVADRGAPRLPTLEVATENRFAARPIDAADLLIPNRPGLVRAIQAQDGELITREVRVEPRRAGTRLLPDPERDLALLLVMNRYQPSAPALAFVNGFGLKRGAMASSVAHDSHNILAVGVDLADLVVAVNTLVSSRGGIAVADGGQVESLPLPIAGLMSDRPGEWVAARYAELDRRAHGLGSPLRAPFMTLSFMALLVIPELKLSDRGLFDGRRFEFVSNYVSL